MLIAEGEFRFETRRGGETIAIEEDSLAAGVLRGRRTTPGGPNVYEVEAELDADGFFNRMVLRYSRGPFARTAVYEATGDFLRGNLSAMAGRNEVTTKLGRYREVDAGLFIFRAFTIAHIRARAQSRWTGRVAAIDPNTLVAATHKQSCRISDLDRAIWIYEPRMGDREEIEIDADGRPIRRRDNLGLETVLMSARAQVRES
jgi:hypothetical protein